MNQVDNDSPPLEGVAANIKLLLKLVQEHKHGGGNDDSRRALRVATMVVILDTVRNRIQRCQSNNSLDRSSSSASASTPTEILTRELSVSLDAQKSLKAMCSSLGKEKEIMAGELLKKAREVGEMEELVADLRAQNEALIQKARKFAGESLQERNRVLTEQLLRSLEGYRSMKRKLRVAQEDNMAMRVAMDEMRAMVQVGDGGQSVKEGVSAEEI